MKSARESERDNFFTKVLEEINNDVENGNWKALSEKSGILRYAGLMCLKISDMANLKYANRNQNVANSESDENVKQ